MYLFTYKLPKDELNIEIYHNRAEVHSPDRSPRYFYSYEDIGEIMGDLGMIDRIDELQIV